MYSFNFFALLSLVVADVYLILAVYIFFRNPRATTNRLFFLMGLTMAIWGLGEGMARAALDHDTAFFWASSITGVGAAFHPAVLLHFWLVFSGQVNTAAKKLLVLLIYVPAAMILVIRLLLPELMVEGMVLEYWGYSTEGTLLYYALYVPYLVGYVSVVVYLALMTSAQSHGKLKEQARNIGLGVLGVILIGIMTQGSRPVFHLPVPELTVVSTIVFISLIAYAVNKYGLLVITAELAAENLVATMEDLVVAADRDLMIALINSSVLGKLGYSESDLVGQPLNKLLALDSLSFQELFKKLPLSNHQMHVKAKDGTKVPVSVNASVLKGGSDDNSGFLFVFRDMRQINDLITDLQHKRQELQASKETLEQSNQEFQRMNELMTGRELRMIEMKKEIEELKRGGN